MPGGQVVGPVSRATIVRDADLPASTVVKGGSPDLVWAVDITSAIFHCAKCVIRSKLWSVDQDAEKALADDTLLAETMVKHGGLSLMVERMQEIIVDDEINRLY